MIAGQVVPKCSDSAAYIIFQFNPNISIRRIVRLMGTTENQCKKGSKKFVNNVYRLSPECLLSMLSAYRAGPESVLR